MVDPAKEFAIWLRAWFLKQGHAFEVVCLNDPGSDFLSGGNFPIHALGTGRGPWRYHPRLLPWLNINLPRFDAVIMNGLWQYTGYAVFKATQSEGKPPYFVFPHGMLDPWFQQDSERKIKAVRNWCYWKFFEQRVIHSAEALMFTCAEEMRLARERFSLINPSARSMSAWAFRSRRIITQEWQPPSHRNVPA